MKILSTILFLSVTLTSFAQDDLSNYLRNHNYSFSINDGFDQRTSDTLKKKLGSYKLILQAEGGSHNLKIYDKLPVVWTTFLSSNFGLTHLFLEFSHPSAICVNQYLQTADAQNLYNKKATFWEQFLRFNSKLDTNKRLKTFGIDFNRPNSYLKGLKLLLPNVVPPETIKKDISLINQNIDTILNCDDILSINAILKKGLANYRTEYQQYLGKSFEDFERIIISKGTCNDVYKNRNFNMADNFLSFDSQKNDKMYYGQLGMAHTILSNKVFSNIVNKSSNFKDKVCVINLYCHNCFTEKEPVSNWPLKKIDDDIQKYFLPLCVSDFTLFDLSENITLIKKYRAFGQYLIIAKDQN